MKTPVSILQEYVVKQKLSNPDYNCERCGLPEPFKYTVRVGDVVASGRGSNKQIAKHKCARSALEKFGIQTHFQDENNNSPISSSPQLDVGSTKAHINYVGLLNETAALKKYSHPTYSHSFSLTGTVKVTCSFLKWNTDGIAMKKKVAKQESAQKMLQIIKQNEKELIQHGSQIQLPVHEEDNLDALTKKAMEKVEELSITPNQPLRVFEDVIPRILAIYPMRSLEELRAKLEENGYISIVETIQRNPSIMTLKLKGHSCVLMGQGRTEKDAEIDLFQTTMIMFVKGYNFRNHCK